MATPRLLWGEKRRERVAAGERGQGRNRGKGAQLRRRLRGQQSSSSIREGVFKREKGAEQGQQQGEAAFEAVDDADMDWR